MATKKPKRAFKGVWIPKQIWDSKDLSWQNKCLLAEIDSLDDGAGCYAQNKFLAERFDTTPESIKVTISKLRKLGWIVDKEVAENGNTERRISINLPLIPVNSELTPVNLPLTPVNPTVNSHLPRGKQPLTEPTPLIYKRDTTELPLEIPVERGCGAEAPTTEDGGKPKSISEVIEECIKAGQPEATGRSFFSYYESNGWRVGKNPMKKWRAALSGWINRECQYGRPNRPGDKPQIGSLTGADKIVFQKELERVIEKMKQVKGTYSGHQTWDEDDKDRFIELRKRRDELKGMLGVVC